MVRELDSLRDDVGVIRQRQGATFPESAPATNLVFLNLPLWDKKRFLCRALLSHFTPFS
ncbi:hypothetical protein [Anabaena sp. PCC 7108]|uniref:hypothetical protein n=1 Tax=Anabaena sp. PCC 7108 TaxID=163908 RepID=UPI00130E9D2A|nr:hypothetical protein [Anabaena sp. PCC 7108]